MGSANGRHRRPRQAPAIVVAAGVTGSALAIPLLAAGSAGAADANTWDKVAECESGGTWSADFGNGYYGGLQFSQETWSAYGGTDYAQRADLASRTQQIAVAEKVLDAKGPQAWPGCAVISGLAPAGTPIGVDPGSTDAGASAGTIPDADGAPVSTGTTESTGTSGSTGASDSGTTTGSSATPGPDASVTPSPSGSATPGATTPGKSGAKGGATDAATADTATGGKHRGTPDPAEAAAADASRDTGRHASRGDGEARDDATLATDGTYTVQSGDNLWAIADAQNLSDGWTELYQANESVIGSDPDLILPGQELDLSTAAAPAATDTAAAASDTTSDTPETVPDTAETAPAN
ncbi:transglycosylase family protein [Streptomyces sp. NPDC060198]|uniref:transglycosylase family protein n=1 Tax=Streptomyces sp. NPDC060198 TaxID=3347070 RepID=UPI003654A3AD